MAVDKNGGPNCVQAWREFRGLTREELADRLGTSATMVWSLEMGERALTMKWLRRLSDALEVAPSNLMDHAPGNALSGMLNLLKRAQPVELRQIEALAETVIGLRRETGE